MENIESSIETQEEPPSHGEAAVALRGIRNEVGEVDIPEEVRHWTEIIDPVAQGV